MIKTVLLYDNRDARLGTFFDLCANKFSHLHNTVYNQNISTRYDTESCRKDIIESALSTYNSSEFLFVSFLHGSEDAMYISDEEIISASNAYFFTNAFCYTFSCYCGKNLAPVLIENNAHVFWGYVDKAYIAVGFEEEFAELAISGLNHFLKNETIESAFNKVREEYTKKIDELYKENFFVASTLFHNKESMIVYGNKSMTISDFTI
jgi:hypothetical protein